MAWDPPVAVRNQIVLFSERLDEVIPANHPVRFFWDIVDQLDWSAWESCYQHEGPGRPPVHPKVMSSIVLYGLLRRVRSSRQLEEALGMRYDFHWLAEGRRIDHSTICRFRQAHEDRLKDLFTKITLVAKEAGLLSLAELGVDGTKIRANNHRSNKFKVEELQDWKKQLEIRYEELHKEAMELDELEAKQRKKLDKQLANTQKRQRQVARAIEEVERIEARGDVVPTRIPTTDVESRVTKSKEGGFAPNYTPVNVVDTKSGMIVATEVIAGSDEKSVLPGAMDQIEDSLGERPKRAMGDTIYNHGSNLKEMDERNIELYTPIKDTEDNPAIRDDPTQPVSPEKWDQLPVEKGQFSKEAFIFAGAEEDRYYCPQGERLEFESSYNKKLADGSTSRRRRYYADAKVCAACPLRDRCLAGKSQSKGRQVSRDEAEELRDQLRQRMSTDEGKEIYNRRMIAERPFAAIKQGMGLRQFLHCGLDKVRVEWLWATIAYNIDRLISLLSPRAGPDESLVANLHPP